MCIDEVMFALTMLKDKASTWFEFVTTRAKGVECKSGQRDTFTLADNVVYNMILRKTVYPEVVIGTYQYTDGSSSNEYNHHYGMAMELVHESCHVKQMHDLRPWFFLSKNPKEKEYHTTAGDALKKMDSLQYLIDWNQDIL